VPTATSPLAQQARGRRWWLRALRRSPLLCGLIVAQFLVVPVIWAFWEPPLWLKTLITFVLLGPILNRLGNWRERTAREVEHADEAAERTGARRPLSAPAPAQAPATFTWRSPAGHRVLLASGIFAALTATGAGALGFMLHGQPPQTTGDDAAVAIAIFFVVALPAALGVINSAGVVRRVRQVLAGAPDPVVMEAVGIDPRRQLWILERPDNGARVMVRFMGGRRLLVAGDQFLARGALVAPPYSWRRLTPAVFAVTGQFGTLWAMHTDPKEPIPSSLS
jgi:hypothetical protein